VTGVDPVDAEFTDDFGREGPSPPQSDHGVLAVDVASTEIHAVGIWRWATRTTPGPENDDTPNR
jgi:hypothetical protein